MNIYLKHPEHGTKVATCEAEVEADTLNGWEEFDPYAKEQPIEAALAPTKKRIYVRKKK